VSGLDTWWRLDVAELAPRAHADAAAATEADLVARLAEPHRRYHGPQHLVEMFWALEELEAAGSIGSRQTALARVAAWFHDAVYDPAAPAGANESDSAELASRALRALGMGGEDVATVCALVTVSAEHRLPADGLHAAFHDADLWILAAPEDRFDEYCTQVREEYAAVPDPEYASGRTAVLTPFLRRESVYATAHGQAAWEERARRNLSRELSRLS
jgi:predicted metal-dependent HD superfamily phosphohydrolase